MCSFPPYRLKEQTNECVRRTITANMRHLLAFTASESKVLLLGLLLLFMSFAPSEL